MTEVSRSQRTNGPYARTLHSHSGITGHPLSPVIILGNMSQIGLGIARNIAGHGPKVIALTTERDVYGNSSRFCELRFGPDSAREPERLHEFLMNAADELTGAVIYPTRDLDIVFLDRFRCELEAHYHLVIPSHGCIEQVMDKEALVRAAIRARVPVPRTIVVCKEEDLLRVPEEIGLPCLVKPVNSFHWRTQGRWEKIGRQKAFRVDDMGFLRQLYDRVVPLCSSMLVQEFVSGGANQLASACGYLDDKSEPWGYFTARIIHKYPDYLGSGCLVENMDIPDLRAQTLRLWREVAYQGIADVEYKQDLKTGEWKLIEINTRPWDWHQLGRASGANLSWLAYCHLTRTPTGSTPTERVATKWVNEESLLLFCLRGVYRRELGIVTFLKQLRGKRMYGVFAWNDPVPFIKYLVSVLIPSTVKALVSVWRRPRETA